MIYQADWLLTPGKPPLPQGWIHIEDHIILAMGSGSEVPGTPVQFPGCVLVPGLVNAHSHIELTGLENKIPRSSFPKWVAALRKVSEQYRPEDYRLASTQGIARLLAGGTTSVLDVGNTGESLAALAEGPLRALGFVEVLGLDPELAVERFTKAIELAEYKRTISGRFQAGLSVHSLYSCSTRLIRLIDSHQQTLQLPLSLHVAESREEFELFSNGSGSLQDYCQSIYPQAPLYRNTSPIELLNSSQALSGRTVIIHGNHLTQTDIKLLAHAHATVVHCPSSHAFFGHAPFPYAQLQRNGIRVCLGTDSLASGDSLSMLHQMKLFRKSFREATGPEILTLATKNGAEALGFEKIGRLEPGCKADTIAIRFDPALAHDPYEAILADNSEVDFSVIDGQVCY